MERKNRRFLRVIQQFHFQVPWALDFLDVYFQNVVYTFLDLAFAPATKKKII